MVAAARTDVVDLTVEMADTAFADSVSTASAAGCTCTAQGKMGTRTLTQLLVVAAHSPRSGPHCLMRCGRMEAAG